MSLIETMTQSVELSRTSSDTHPEFKQDAHTPLTRKNQPSRISKALFFFIRCFAALGVCYSVQAQDVASDIPDSLGLRVGAFAHYAYSMHVADFQRMSGTQSCCSSFTGGSGSGAHLGLLTEIPLSQEQLLVFRLDYMKQSFSMLTPEKTRMIVGNSVQDGLFEHHLEGDFTSLGLEPLLSWRMSSGLSANAGLRVAWVNQSNYSQWEQLSQPVGVGTFMNNDGTDSHRRTRNVYNNAIDNLQLQWSVALGASYELPMNRKKSWLLCPEIFYHYALNNLSSDMQWKAHSLNLGVALKYCPSAKKIITHQPYDEIDTLSVPLIADSNARVVVLGLAQNILDSTETSDEIVIRQGVRRRDTLFIYTKPDVVDAQLSAAGLDTDGREIPNAQIRTEEFLSTEMTPLLPFVFFDHNSSTIPERYQQSAASRAAVTTELERLHSNRLEVYYQILNILGSRMQQNPRAVVTLTGCTDNLDVEERNTALAKARAESLRNYLSSEWNIAADRIRIETRMLPAIPSSSNSNDGAAENRRVEISCNDFAIIAPVLHRDTLRSSNPPTVRFHLNAAATRGIATWKMDVSQLGTVVKSWSGVGAPPATIDWPLNTVKDKGPSSSDSLKLLLSVKDSLGKEKSVQAQVGVELITIRKKKLERRGDKEIAHFGVNLFAIRHSDVSALDRQVLNIVKHNIQANSTINVYGFTDRTGDPTYNRNLALSRAKSVAQELAPFKVLNTDVKNEAPSYNNDVPEGRFYSRTVEIEAETPLQY